MRCVTAHAVFGDRLVFPKEGSALFGMTSEAGFIHRILRHLLGTRRAMSVVAIRASHLSGIDRVRRYLKALGALRLVTGEAHFGLRLLVADLVDFGVNLVAGVTGHIVGGVLAAFPMGALGVALVASHAGVATLLG